MDEIYDVIDKEGNKISTATWTEVHTKGLLHQVAAVLIFKDDSKSEVLIASDMLSPIYRRARPYQRSISS